MWSRRLGKNYVPLSSSWPSFEAETLQIEILFLLGETFFLSSYGLGDKMSKREKSPVEFCSTGVVGFLLTSADLYGHVFSGT
jgi:hypothetical protein